MRMTFLSFVFLRVVSVCCIPVYVFDVSSLCVYTPVDVNLADFLLFPSQVARLERKAL
jgi:hypothetical protein